jgi:SET domain-containing protein
LLSHSKNHANLKPIKEVDHTGRPHILFVAARDIEAKEELLFDYGVREKKALKDFPWLSADPEVVSTVVGGIGDHTPHVDNDA